MSLSYIPTCVVVSLIVLACISAMLFSIFILKKVWVVVASICVICISLSAGIGSIVFTYNCRKAVTNGTDTYAITLGNDTHIEELYYYDDTYYDANYNTAYMITAKGSLLIYKDGERVGASGSYTIVKSDNE